MDNLLVDEDHSKAILAVVASYRGSDCKYAMMVLITAIVILIEETGLDKEKTAEFVAEMINCGRKIEMDIPECPPN